MDIYSPQVLKNSQYAYRHPIFWTTCKLTIFIAILTFLVGCASAPPQRRVQEKSSKPATQKSYKVMGKWYSPLSSSDGYHQRGVASWYGKKFHGRKTANGETYNMYGMSAAHKTLPLGTYVKVTRLDTSDTITVRINDRGPFVKGRIIDLSYKAAKGLNIVEEGTAPVIVEALGEKQGGTYVARDYRIGEFTVQVGAFAVKGNAHRLRGDLKRVYGHATIQRYDTGTQTFYRVRVGRYSTLEEGEKAKNDFEQRGFVSPFVVAER
ncbi:MAG: septal ring lytic transglycosylase RlpA family protein [Deltaproteobacteria bacterium]|nr:septal ring lytic transglycosylase RlpA family protein [Deltaproteobacteria bacterium]